MEVRFRADPEQLPRAVSGGVRFVFDAAPGVRSVALAGTFNSWVGDACLLERVTDTRWRTVLPLAAGRHLYKIVVDGTDWIPDPANPWISEDGQNNSCLTVDEAGEVFVRQIGLDATAPGPLHARDALVSPQWLRDGVIYQLSIRAFGGDFDGVRQKLGHLSDLGADVLWIMPVQPVGLRNRRGSLGDPYAVCDFDAIDPALGDADAFRSLVAEAHSRGMRVILDWTLNRSSADHPFTRTHPHWYTRRADGSVCYLVPGRDEFAGFEFADRTLRRTLIGSMRGWIERFDIDGLRFDDSDITPRDFLEEIRTALAEVRPDIGIISQAYDEFHHLSACDLTYEGGTREMLSRCARGEVDGAAFARYWNESAYSFPKGALRMRWLEDKEQGRVSAFLGRDAHRPAAAVLFAMDGVPHILMGQEFDEPTWAGWQVLFDDYELDGESFDSDLFAHYRTLIALRRAHPVLRTGGTSFLDGVPPGGVGLVRHDERERVMVLANLSSSPLTFAVDAAHAEPLYSRGWDGAVLAPHGWMISKGAGAP